VPNFNLLQKVVFNLAIVLKRLHKASIATNQVVKEISLAITNSN